MFDWQLGPMTAQIGGSLAEVEVPEGYVFLDKENTQGLLELMGNPVSGLEMATLASASDKESWFLFFDWEATGWVDDAEKDDLDAKEILAGVREGTEAANELRRERGWSPLEIVGWHREPYYDEETKNLTWAINAQSDGEAIVNHLVKVLGRRGVMTVTLVSDPLELESATRQANLLLSGYAFQSGNRYAEYLPGKDKIAEYGLTALIVGGGAAALIKSGFLVRFWKLLVLGGAAVLAWLRRLFSKSQASGEPTKPL